MRLIKTLTIIALAIGITNIALATTNPTSKSSSATKHKKLSVKKKLEATKHNKSHKKHEIAKKIVKKQVNNIPAAASNNTDIALDDVIESTIVTSTRASAVSTTKLKHVRPPKVYSYSVKIVDDKNSQVLFTKNPTVVLPIASITKLMTAMVLLDSGVDMGKYITIAPSDVDTMRNTFSRLRVGMQIRRSDLLLLALMSSENRAAAALARTTYAGGTDAFVRKMNQKAISLGMTNTKFYDATGLDNANVATADDLAKMVKTAFSYPLIRQDTTTREALVRLSPTYVHRYLNSDRLVRGDSIQIAVSKTGYINESGHCLVLYTIIRNTPIIMIFLNSPGNSGRMLDALAIKNYLENNYFNK